MIKRRLVDEEWVDRAHEMAEVQLQLRDLEAAKEDYMAGYRKKKKPLETRIAELALIVSTREEEVDPQPPLPLQDPAKNGAEKVLKDSDIIEGEIVLWNGSATAEPIGLLPGEVADPSKPDSDAYPFKCVCGDAFKEEGNLRDHIESAGAEHRPLGEPADLLSITEPQVAPACERCGIIHEGDCDPADVAAYERHVVDKGQAAPQEGSKLPPPVEKRRRGRKPKKEENPEEETLEETAARRTGGAR